MGTVDGLSRRPDWQEGVERNNEDQMLIKSKWISVKDGISESGGVG